MAFSLSFAESFFTGHGDIYHLQASERPTSVMQAVISLSVQERVSIALTILNWTDTGTVFTYVETIDFLMAVLEAVRETDTCYDLRSPCQVYIDPDGFHFIWVYDSE